MAKAKTRFVCQSCGSSFPKWQGKCDACGEWNTLQEEAVVETKTPPRGGRSGGYAGVAAGQVQRLHEVDLHRDTVMPSGISEFDRVLGGGLVRGSVVLIGGDPGIGKSTLLLQTVHHLAQQVECLYVSGEESPRQIGLRAQRLGLSREKIALYSETQIERILATAEAHQPQVLVVDSIQTLYSEALSAAPGAVSQLRECAAQLVRFAKNSGTTVFLIGHVTKEGAIAGPRVLEHMVDTVLYFESEAGSRFRMLRAIKNRFGPVNELGMFAMLENGLKAVSNPSAIFLSRPDGNQAGSAIFPVWEGSRALLVEVQALVDANSGNYARRVTQGFDGGRLAMLLAVLNRHGGISMHDMDVYVNVVGGLKISETASDLAVLAAAVSSLRGKAIARDTVIFGEVGLAGELRPAANGEARIKAAEQHGFKKLILPRANLPRARAKLSIYAADTLSEALEQLKEMEE
ncbi:DNA repair protein RadA [Suttonella indologenes]|uniref:DNA repair protein RadA n=1 Tax=Suttonella indologenes TaxID=13276 RepID=A0A380MWG9_9GAMM|nr:DNA repair protein RadA [Suttonella indologenes]SUO96396.1 DNA repair protein RadA [Suttonella indologenes]